MPFYWIARTIDAETLDARDFNDLASYASPRDAHANRPDGEVSLYYRETLAERADWTHRELSRFEVGEYTRTPWYDDDRHWLHFAHMSQKEAGKIAYTPIPEYGIQDRQNILPIDRYLAKYYAEVSDEKRRSWQAADLKFATTADDCETLYTGKKYTRKPFYSCIGYGFSFDVHPARVYGNSDLAVAYIGPIDACDARVVVWPDRKVYNRIFCIEDPIGTRIAKVYDRFVALLTAAGYTPGSLDGAKIRKIEHPDGGWVMPYIDNVSAADDSRDRKFHILGRGDLSTSETSGRAGDTGECAHCGDSCDSEETYCRSCDNDRNYCEHCDNDRFGESFYTVPGCNLNRSYSREVCETCTENDSRSRRRCALCNSRWYEWQLDTDDQIERHDNGTDRFCTDCADTARICETCDSAYETDDDDDGKCTDCRETDDDDDTDDGINETDDSPATATDDSPATATAIPMHCASCGVVFSSDRTHVCRNSSATATDDSPATATATATE